MKNLLIHLSLLEGIGPAAITAIINYASAYAEQDIYLFSSADFIQAGLSQALAATVVSGLQNTALLDRELELADRNQITILTILDEAYPSLLKQIYLPPAVLYIQGTVPSRISLAVVGSRKASSYAVQAIERLLPPLIDAGWIITSGGAIGVDTSAHRLTVQKNGITIAVLGSGLLRLYPRENKKLFEDIVAMGGALVSPFSLHVEPLPGNFPARNRIIAGLSVGCLVVQAARKSGARITAQYALEQGKEVFAVPGHLNDPLQEGCHELIQQGAKLVIRAADIANECAAQRPLILSNDDAEPTRSQPLSDPLLSLCKNPASFEDILHNSNLSCVALQEKLFYLQLDGKIEQNFAGLWQAL